MIPISTTYSWKKLSPDDDFHYFFGYYDRNPWNDEMTMHLALKVSQCERLPERGETAEIGLFDRLGNWQSQVTTRAWCHQQGSMELFLPQGNGEFIFNDYDSANDRIITRVFKPGSGLCSRHYDSPVYAISPDGNWAVSLNFARIPRRGYSYADAVLSTDFHPKDLDADGLTLVNLKTGEAKLIVSYRTMLERHPYPYTCENKYIWLNHAIFNCDSTRILWLFRQTLDPLRPSGWQTFMYTCDLTGEDAECTLSDAYWRTNLISHQIWGREPRQILVDAAWDETGHHAVVFDESVRPFRAQKLADSHGSFAHMVFSKDGKYILADSYPDTEKIQTLALIEADSGKMDILGRFRHIPDSPWIGDTRCDLHPRWSNDGKTVTVDSYHDGKRAIWLLNL